MATKDGARAILPKSKYLWCLHCEQVDMHVGWVHNYGYCPYEDCNGNAIDAWAWRTLREVNSDYPVVPDYDVVYPLYPEKL